MRDHDGDDGDPCSSAARLPRLPPSVLRVVVLTRARLVHAGGLRRAAGDVPVPARSLQGARGRRDRAKHARQRHGADGRDCAARRLGVDVHHRVGDATTTCTGRRAGQGGARRHALLSRQCRRVDGEGAGEGLGGVEGDAVQQRPRCQCHEGAVGHEADAQLGGPRARCQCPVSDEQAGRVRQGLGADLQAGAVAVVAAS